MQFSFVTIVKLNSVCAIIPISFLEILDLPLPLEQICNSICDLKSQKCNLKTTKSLVNLLLCDKFHENAGLFLMQ